MEEKEAFQRKFPEKDTPTNMTIWKNVKKYEREGTCLNTNKERSGRRKTVMEKQSNLLDYV